MPPSCLSKICGCLRPLIHQQCHNVHAGMTVSVMLAMRKRKTEEASTNVKAEVAVDGIRSDPDVEVCSSCLKTPTIVCWCSCDPMYLLCQAATYQQLLQAGVLRLK